MKPIQALAEDLSLVVAFHSHTSVRPLAAQAPLQIFP
jgi:hypothetical protein